MQRTRFSMIILAAVLLMVGGADAGRLTSIEQLGKIMFQDKDLSFNGSQSCMTCHHHAAGFADPENSRDPYVSVVSVGADGVSLGGRNAPTAAYTGFSPVLHWDEVSGGYIGGMFWDGRATGMILGDPLAEQAQGPVLNPVEMNMPDPEAVVQVIRQAPYANLFRRVFGPQSLDDPAMAFIYFARAIAAFERSAEVLKFSSRFDQDNLSAGERQGLELFQRHCAACHSSQPLSAGTPALFTTHGYANLGIPANPLLASNPQDLGLGGFLESDYHSDTPLIADAEYALQYGKFKIPTLRNAALTAPYGHNGFFPTLKSIIDFHNTRDLGGWPEPEVPQNLTLDIGRMGLSEVDVDALVAFLTTLSDAPRVRP